MARQTTKTPRAFLQRITNQHLRVLLIILLILISTGLSITYRSYPATLPITDQWAENSIITNLKNQITTGINQQYPNLPPERKQALVNEQLTQVIKQQETEIAEQAKTQGQYIRERLQKDDGQTYLLAIDPYFYYRHTKNVLDHGYGADVEIDGVKINNHMLAPIGRAETETDYHTRFSAMIYKIVRFFNKDAELFNVFFWMPVIISSLAVIPAFFITRKKAGNLGGFIAGTIVAVHSTFLGRTAAGFADTDSYNVTFPLLILWMFIEAFDAKDLKKKLIYSGLTGLFLGIYSKFWSGWWYIFDFMLITIIAYLGFRIIKSWLQTKDVKRIFTAPEVKNAGRSILGVLVASGIFVSLFSSFSRFINGPLGAVKFASIQNAAKIDLWPNVFTTVAELNRASLSSIVNQIGGSAYFYLACLGLLLSLITIKEFKNKDWAILGGGAFLYLILITKPLLRGNPYVFLALLLIPVATGILFFLKDQRDIDIKYALFLVVWFAGTIYASTQGVRFILVLVPAYAVALGILIGQLYKLVITWSEKNFEIDQAWIKAGLIIIALLILIKPINAGKQAALHEIPSMNDAWWSSLTKINEEAAPDAIINSWWDFGHWFKAIGDRAVTFDGTSQNTPMAHWVGRALSTNNEEEAVGILRMLDCGSRKGFDTLAEHVQGDGEAITPETTLQARAIMGEIILIEDQEAATAYLEEQGLTQEEAEDVTRLTHCEPPENYFITSSDMIGKASVWGHFGNWDFRKAYAYNVLRKETPDVATPIIEELFDIETKAAGQLYYQVISLANEQAANAWISPWPQYLTRNAISCQDDNDTVTCNQNVNLGNQQGQTIRLETVVVDLENPENTIASIGAYNRQTGQRVGENTLTLKAVTIKNNNLETTRFENPGLDFELFLVQQGSSYKAVIASSELATSMFTRLFFLEGAHTKHFEKFSDERSPITGDRIIVWKVNW
ncbi:hypothetical protein GF367_01950 [Candidatus Woesearchaeota archaeon]|nr:hypothetical protein [Candidatus Woesearchaeota archaeon]